MKRVGILTLGALLLLGLVACSTSKGSLLEEAAERDEKDSEIKMPRKEEDYTPDRDFSEPEKPAKKEERIGLVISPTRRDDRDHYYLDEITGFVQVTTVPPEAEVNFGPSWLPAGKLHEIDVGSRIFRIRAFGYEEKSVAVDIVSGRTTELSVVLKQADFSLSNLEASQSTFNPRNPGPLGSVHIRFRISGPGSGSAAIVDSQNQTRLYRRFGTFTTWEQGFDWEGRDKQGVPLPDGAYTVRIRAQGARSGKLESAELKLKIDSSMVPRFRSLWSGSAGLLYAPSPEILPGGKIQVSSAFLAHASGAADSYKGRVPVNFALRAGLNRRNLFELDTSIGGIIGVSTETLYIPWFVTAAVKSPLLRFPGDLSLATSAQIKLTYQDAHTDTLANSSGLSLGLPTALHWGSFSFLFSPELILSPHRVSYDPEETLERGLYGWFYCRTGLLLDLPPFSFGASLTLRTLPFNEGFGLDLPFQTALEAHWLVLKPNRRRPAGSPGTRIFLSLYVAAEFEAADSYYLLGGAGWGILN